MNRRITYFLVGILLALAGPMLAQDEVLSPDGTVESISNSCTTGNAHTTLDDDPDSPGGDWCTSSTCAGNPTNDTAWRLTFGTPGTNPSTATDAQTFAAYVRSCQSGGTDPTCRLDLYCNGSLVESGSDQAITSATGQLITELVTFNAGSCASDGSDAEVRLYCTASGGSPSGRRTGEADAVEWRVTYASAMSRRVIVVGSE